jgi:flagellar hook-associated protein 1 FlgK
MSIPTLQGLQTALSGLIAQQDAIDVTGNNITNANTEGYSRQTAVLQTKEPLHVAALSAVTGEGGQLGTGVTVATITRIRNTYLDAAYREHSTAAGAAGTQAEELQQAQSAFDEPSSTGLASQLSAFWSSWGELADAPTTSEAAKIGVVGAATQLTGSLHQLSAQLQSLEGQASAQYAAIAGPTGEVASDAAQIAELNHQIKLSLGAHQQPNELEDHRDLLIDKLSTLASVTVTKAPDGTDTVTFGNAAQPLVEGATVTWPQTLTAAAGGKLGTLLELSSPTGALASYGAALNEVAKTLADSVNELHTATPFFKGTTAATIEVAVAPGEVQTSSEGASGNNVALAIAGLRGGVADQHYAALVAQVGTGMQNATTNQTNSQAVLAAVSNQRQSVSGVSLDEEMTNLITFQRGYQASAQALNVMNEMLNTLINQSGL